MERKEYLIPCILLSISIIFMIYFALVFQKILIDENIGNRLPGRRDRLELFYIFIFPSLLVILTTFIFGRILLRVYIIIAKFFRDRSYEVALNPINRKFSGKLLAQRTLLPTMLVLSAGLAANNNADKFNLEFLQVSTTSNIIVLTLLALPLITLFIFPIWFSEDIAIVLYQKYDKTEHGIHISPVCDGINNILKGWAGISVILNFIVTILDEIASFNFVQSIFILLFPLVLFGLFIPIQLIYIKLYPRMRNRIMSRMQLKQIHIQYEFSDLSKNFEKIST